MFGPTNYSTKHLIPGTALQREKAPRHNLTMGLPQDHLQQSLGHCHTQAGMTPFNSLLMRGTLKSPPATETLYYLMCNARFAFTLTSQHTDLQNTNHHRPTAVAHVLRMLTSTPVRGIRAVLIMGLYSSTFHACLNFIARA